MRLRDLKFPRKHIVIGNGPDDFFSVRGLNLLDISFIVREYKDRVTTLFAKFMGVPDQSEPQDPSDRVALDREEDPDELAYALAINDPERPAPAAARSAASLESIVESKDPTDFVLALLDEAPDIAALLIAVASDDDEPEGVDAALRMPFPLQVEALEAIAVLTLTNEGGLKKVLDTIIRSAEGTTKVIDSLRS